jgi:hypothetical protein
MPADAAHQIIKSILEEARARRKQDRRADQSPFYLGLIEEHTDQTVLDFLWDSLRHEYLLHDKFEAATEIALKGIAARPLHPIPLLALVGQKHYSEKNPAVALPLGIKAVALADGVREFRRHARAMLLRVASDLGDTALVEQCLVEIMDLDLAPGEPDVAREADLLVHAKHVGVEKAVQYRYRAFLGPVSLPITGELPAYRSRQEDADE